jgi:ribosomal-protein-alanine N-acetyltransferase
MDLRRASPDDLDDVMTLERAGFAAGIVETAEVFARRIEAFPRGFLLAGRPAWGYLCAEVWDGFDLADPHRFDLGHDIGSWLVPEGDTLYIASMTVHPSTRETGRGRALFEAGLERLCGEFPRVRQAVLIVNEHWSAARRIYDGVGFTEVGRLPGFFQPVGGPNGDALILCLDTRGS